MERTFALLAVIIISALPVFASAVSCVDLTETLSIDSTGDEVSALQVFLTDQYKNFTIALGVFNETTEAALKQWQSDHHIVSTGDADTTGWGATGAKTRAALACPKRVEIAAPKLVVIPNFPDGAQATVKGTGPLASIKRTLIRGMSGRDVKILQQFLINEGNLTPGSASGFFGAMTEQGVKDWQSGNSLIYSGTPSTTGYGSVGARTRAAMALVESNNPAAAAEQTSRKAPSDLFGSYLGVGQFRATTTVSGGQTSVYSTSTAFINSNGVPSGPMTNGSTVYVNAPVWQSTCSFNGQSVANGGSVVAYQYSSVAVGGQCFPQVRTCMNGTLIGTYANATCSPASTGQSGVNGTVLTPASFSSTTVLLISNAHRFAPTMPGGANPQLGHLLRASNGLWFVDDTGTDASVDPVLAYYHLVNGSWSLAASSPTQGLVQQNTASLSDATFIYSYGVDLSSRKIEECYFSPTQIGYRSCGVLPFDVGTARIAGASVSANGTKIVWWTTTSGLGTDTIWNYIYNSGNGWKGPVSSAIGGYSDFTSIYLRVASDDSRIELVGTASKAAGGQDALYGSAALGQTVTNWSMLSVGSAADIWIDTRGGVHVLTAPGVKYFYKPYGSVFQAGSTVSTAAILSRFLKNFDTLYLLISGVDKTLSYKQFSIPAMTGVIDWNAQATKQVQLSTALGALTLFPESEMYQTLKTTEVNTAINGSDAQGIIQHVQLK